MHLRLSVFIFSCLLMAFGMARAQAQSLPPAGKVKLLRPENVVWVTEPGGSRERVVAGRIVSESAVIVTEQGAKVILQFSNRATAQLGERTTLKIEKYFHDSSATSATGGDPEVEAGRSETVLAMAEGEIVGNVKLRKDGGSAFKVQTPVGAAGIRGTTFRIVYRPPGTGQAFGTFTLTNATGDVFFQQGGPGQPAPPGAPPVSAAGTFQGIDIPQGAQIEVVVVVNAQGVAVPQVQVTSSSPIQVPQSTLQQLRDLSVAITQAVQQVTTPSTTGTPGTPGQPGTPQPTTFTAEAGGATATGTIQSPPRIPENINTSTPGPR